MPRLHKRKNGKYYIIYDLADGQIWRSLRTSDKKTGKERFIEKADQFDRGLLDLPRKRRIPTLQELFDEYLPFCKTHRAARTHKDAESHIRLALGPALGHIRARDLEPRHIEAFTGKMLNFINPETRLPEPYAPRTINLRLETLRKILMRAVENKVLPTMPCKIKMLKEPKGLPRYAYQDQLKEWMSYLDREHRLRALLSLCTGITDRDLGYVMLHGYDPHNRLVRFRRPKTTTDIVVPLNDTAMQILAILAKDNPGPELFPAASVKKAYSIASKQHQKEGGQNITPHMLRHSFATYLLSLGVPLSHLKDILGHADIKTTERYAKVLPEYLRDSLAVMDKAGFDFKTILDAPRKDDGRTIGKRWAHKKDRSKTVAIGIGGGHRGRAPATPPGMRVRTGRFKKLRL